MKNIKCPILLFIGDSDGCISLQDFNQINSYLPEENKKAVVRYRH
jgi:hypothetical protein